MHLYNLTLQPPTVITCSAVGNFTGTREQQIAVGRGTRIELLQPNAETGKVRSIAAQEIFGVVRSIRAFRLTGGSKGGFPSADPIL